jgi:hypothetical protein
VQADNWYDLEWYWNVGDAGDPFPGTAGKRIFSATSDATNNSNLYNGSPSNVIITSISNSGAAMTASMAAAAPTILSLENALDNPVSLTFTGTWFGQDLVAFYGGSSAQSGAITHGQSSSLQPQTPISGPASISFYWKVSSEPTNDYINFTVDGVQKAKISGEVNWQQKWYTLAAGSHTLQWKYVKNGSVTKGFDAAWVDKVVVSP